MFPLQFGDGTEEFLVFSTFSTLLKTKEFTSESWLDGQNDAHTHESVYIVLNVKL